VRISPIILIVLTLAGCATPGEPRLRSADDFRALGKFNIAVDYSGSMKPVLMGGERVDVTVVPFDQIEVGQMVVFWPCWKRTPVIHLAIRHEKRGIVTKGIDNRDEDPGYMTADNFIGTAVIVEGPKPFPGLFASR